MRGAANVGATLLILGFVLGVAASTTAQPAVSFDQGGGLWLTSNDAAPGLAGAGTYNLTDAVVGPATRIPAPSSAGYYALTMTMAHTATQYFVFTDDGEFILNLACDAPTPTNPLLGDIELRLDVGSQSYWTTHEVAIACTGPQEFRIPMPTGGLGVEQNETLAAHLTLRVPNANQGATGTLYIIADDPSKPTGLFAPWTSEPVVTPLYVTDQWERATNAVLYQFWATDAPTTSVRFTGQISNSDLDFSITDVATGDTITQVTIDGPLGTQNPPKDFEHVMLIGTGNQTRWVVEIDPCCSAEGHYNLTIEPVLEAQDLLAKQNSTSPAQAPTAPPTTDPGPLTDGAPPGEDKGSPLPAAIPAVAVLAAATIAARRRHNH